MKNSTLPPFINPVGKLDTKKKILDLLWEEIWTIRFSTPSTFCRYSWIESFGLHDCSLRQKTKFLEKMNIGISFYVKNCRSASLLYMLQYSRSSSMTSDPTQWFNPLAH